MVQEPELLEITTNDMLDYWSKLHIDLSKSELENLLTEYFEVKDINCIYELKYKEYVDIDEHILEMNDKENVKKDFFYYELDKFKNVIYDTVNQCSLISDKEMFITHQTKILINRINYECKLFFFNEMINFYKEEKKTNTSIDEAIDCFLESKFNTVSFRKECEVFYPELIKLLILLVEQQGNYLNEILNNIEQDFTEIKDNILDESITEIKRINLGEGDTHCNGKSVAIIEFNSGQIVYKPRNISIEKRFYDFINDLHLKSNGQLSEFSPYKMILKERYSYCEYISYEKLSNINDIQRYYSNLGELLCLLFILNATDIHSENIIAKGSMPYLIDLESLFHSHMMISDNIHDEDFKSMLRESMATVLDVGLLPRKIIKNIDNKDYSVEVGGIGSEQEKVSPFRTISLEIKNGNILANKKFIYSQVNNNNPTDKFDLETLNIITKNLKYGFKKQYTWILNNKQYVISCIKKYFVGEKTRVILRPTYIYGNLLTLSKEPHFLSSYVNRKILISKLGQSKSNYKSIVKSEINQILNNDVPIFYSYTDDEYIYDEQEQRLQYFSEELPIDKVLRKVNMMCEDALDRELSYIDQAMNIKVSNLKSDVTGIKFNYEDNHKIVDESKYIDTAKNIGDFIIKRKIDLNDTSSWISTNFLGKEEIEFDVGPVGNSLYLGNAGVALFMGYLWKYTKEDKYLDVCKRAIRFNIKYIKQSKLYEFGNVGMYNGISGVLLVISTLSKFIDIKEATEVIRYSLNSMKPLIKKDISYDILGGCSGLIVSLIELYKTQPTLRSEISELIEMSYIHIANNRIKNKNYCYWESKVTNAYSGYAHGNAGIVSALMKLKHHENHILNKKLVDDEIIQEALAYIRINYSDKNKNWRSSHDIEKYSNGWCHGAPGILLNIANLKKYKYDDSLIKSESEIGLLTTIKNGLGNNPTYCHGDLGTLEILNELAKVSQNHVLKNNIRNTYIDLYESVISNKWNDAVFKNTESVGLMIGIAGWGYSILRFLYDDEILNFLCI